MAQSIPKSAQTQGTERLQAASKAANPKPTPKQSKPRTQQPSSKPENDKEAQAKEEERRREAAKAAKQSLQAQREAKELTQAAAACGDPEERQKLLNKALEKEIEAETFGKTAKYLNTGAFQGLCAGAGLGGGIGVSLGVLTGTIVGGTTGVITGGLGAGLGLGIGAMHGPWFKMSDLMSAGIRKITGDLPGWKATDEQKAALERMVNGVREQDRPPEEELMRMSEEGGKVEVGKGFVGQRKEDEKQKGVLQGATPDLSDVNPMSSKSKAKTSNAGAQSKSKVDGATISSAQSDPKLKRQYGELAGQGVTPSAEGRKNSSQAPAPSAGVKRKPKKLEVRSARAEAA